MTALLFDPQRNPFDDMRDALEQARRERKNVLIDIGGDWCIWCQRLEAFIESHPTLAVLRAQHYITIRVYVSDKDDTNEHFLSHLPPIDGVPHFIVYNARGLLLCSQGTLAFEEGETYSYERVHAFLLEWSDWHRSPYDKLTTDELKQHFQEFMRPDDNSPALSA